MTVVRSLGSATFLWPRCPRTGEPGSFQIAALVYFGRRQTMPFRRDRPRTLCLVLLKRETGWSQAALSPYMDLTWTVVTFNSECNQIQLWRSFCFISFYCWSAKKRSLRLKYSPWYRLTTRLWRRIADKNLCAAVKHPNLWWWECFTANPDVDGDTTMGLCLLA